jgi:hypothetical protein
MSTVNVSGYYGLAHSRSYPEMKPVDQVPQEVVPGQEPG